VFDIPSVVSILSEFAQEMGYPFSESTVERFIRVGIHNEWLQSVYEEDGKALGVCCVMIAPHLADASSLQAIEYVWHSLPSLPELKRARIMIALLDEMESFAKSKKICLIVSTSEQYKSLGRYCESRGYKLIEHIYRKEAE
jgi:hypothetical protein